MNTPILLVAFGALSSAARDSYARIEADARSAFPDREIHWAYTATSLVARLKQRGDPALTLAEAYAGLRARGFRAVAVQSLHLVPGAKHHEMLAEPAGGLRPSFGAPLLADEADCLGVVADLLGDLPPDGPVLVVAHGHGTEARFNAGLDALGARLSSAREDLFLTRLEGRGDAAGLERFIHSARSAGKAHVCPFLLVAGEHVASDILGDQPGSLKSRLSVPAFSCGPALALRPWVRRRFLAKLGAALSRTEQP
ncbi:MAG: sirohydrochlorin cobaltochelatase [Holophaga sp.]|nr:sirohydrochlorin cobaltochelatase [Holophaga sp.]